MSQHPFVDETSVLVKVARDSWKWMLGLGITAVVIGILVLVWPGRSVKVVGFLFGIYLVVTGVLLLVNAFGPDLPGIARVFYVITGSLTLLVGLACFRDRLQSVVFLAIWIGVSWLITGVTRLVASLSAPGGTPGRGLAGVSGTVIIIGGIVLMVAPIGSLVTLAVVSGCFLIVIGAVEILEGWQLRSAVRTVEQSVS
jgi:uncharacterized membrane protein HdeD (DUF308 family)